jgi:hypothetical protein
VLQAAAPVPDALYVRHGTVIVMLGMDDEAAARVRVQAKDLLSDVDALDASIAHLTRLRDEPVRLGAAS